MKIKLAYTLEERKEAAAAMAALLRLYPGAKIRESSRHEPFKHMYLTTKTPPNPAETMESLDYSP